MLIPPATAAPAATGSWVAAAAGPTLLVPPATAAPAAPGSPLPAAALMNAATPGAVKTPETLVPPVPHNSSSARDPGDPRRGVPAMPAPQADVPVAAAALAALRHQPSWRTSRDRETAGTPQAELLQGERAGLQTQPQATKRTQNLGYSTTY